MPKVELISSTNKILKARPRRHFTRSSNSKYSRSHQNIQNNHENGRFSNRIFSKNKRRHCNNLVHCNNRVNNNTTRNHIRNNLYQESNNKIENFINSADSIEDISSKNDQFASCHDDVNGNLKNGAENTSVNGLEEDFVVLGNFTREVYDAICLRLGDTSHIPEDSVQAVFNDMHLFPSTAQISKMLQCARQYGRRNGANQNYLTFGELCFLIREMQNQTNSKQSYHKKVKEQQVQTQIKTSNNNKCPANKCEVFLGGSCNPTTWREDTAIPELEKQGISFYNPQVSIWAPELLAQEHDAKQSASVLLFVIDSQTRSTVGMLEVAYLVASGRCVIVVAQPYRRGQSIGGETISDNEYFGLVEGQKSLLDLVKSRGVQIHTSLSTALQCTTNILQAAIKNGTTAEEQIVFKLRKLRDVYDSYNGQMRFYDILDAYKKITDRTLEIDKLYNYLSPQNGTTIANSSITFEKFCTLMAEMSTDGCQMCTNAGWATQSFQRQCTTNNKRSNCIVEQPIASAEPPLTSQPTRSYDVFLGGSLATGCHWREDVAIPILKKNGLSYYNPAIREQNGTCPTEPHPSNDTDVSGWRRNIDQSQVALFVVTNDTRSLTTMVLAAHYMGAGKDVVLCVQQLGEGCVLEGEVLTKNATKDYNRARAYLKDVAERKQIPVFENVTDAVQCAVERVRTS